MITRNVFFIAAAIVLSSLSSVNASIALTGDYATTMGAFTCSDVDLVNDSQATLASAERSHRDFFTDGTTIPFVNNGTVKVSSDDPKEGEYFPYNFGGGTGALPVAYTFMLDTTSMNTEGYDITGISSFAGWKENNRSLANQVLTIEISKVNDDSWLAMGEYTYTPFDLTERGESETVISLVNDGGGALDNGVNMATGVDGIRITYSDNGNDESGLDGVALQEIDVFGQASASDVPEPSSILLLASGMLGLLGYVWRKRK